MTEAPKPSGSWAYHTLRQMNSLTEQNDRLRAALEGLIKVIRETCQPGSLLGDAADAAEREIE